MNRPPPVAAAPERVLRFLEARGVESMLIGGLAIRILSIPRPTYDIDLMVSVGEEGVAELAAAADREGFIVGEEHVRGFADRLAGLAKMGFTVPAGGRLVLVDLFLSATDYQRAAFARRRRHESDLGSVCVASPEEVLLHKLLADRPRDRADVADLLLVAGTLDTAYLGTWAARLGVTARLAAALREAGGG